jgi:NodT family efflux transporter outer membrane factor (OMF) lipoprotein
MTMKREQASVLVRAAALALLAGCGVGPDFHRPEAPTGARYTREPLPPQTASADVPGGEEQRFVLNQDIPGRWWTLFQSPALSALVEHALKANPTIQAAEAALRQARELVAAGQGAYYPTVQAGVAPSIQKASATLSPPLSTSALKYQLYTAQLTVGYTPDVFGGNRRLVESLGAQAEVQQFQLEAAALTLSSNVVAAAVQEASLRAQIAATKEIVDVATRSVELLRRQFQAGAVGRLDLAAQEAALAQVEQTLPPLNKQLEQTRNLLAALAGGFPADAPPQPFELASLRLPIELPVSLPSKLIEQRPDVRAGEAQLHAASAQIGVAVAHRLPQFAINASTGDIATHLSQMFTPGTAFWSLAAPVVQTIFDGGTLLHQQRAAEAAFDQAEAQYRSTVLVAFQNVADTLYSLKADAETLKAAVASERAAKVTLDITQKQLQLGAVNYLAVLSSQQAYQQALTTRVQAQAARLTDTAALFQALGGGWWNRGNEKAPGN